MNFPTELHLILERIESINPIQYGRSRNFINGHVTKLSPYISRGVISTRQVAEIVLAKGFKPFEIESFLKELAWRDYFQQVWIALGDKINHDVKNTQEFKHSFLPAKINNAQTRIEAIDHSIQDLYQTGYMHNHARMYVAGVTCNLARCHWSEPAKWMYYHLLDADWASNALSWQWVAGAFSSKKYFANQENINKYANTNQQNTFLDCSYEALAELDLSNDFSQPANLILETVLPENTSIQIQENLPTYIYNFYNLDPKWNVATDSNNVLLLEPSIFKKYPVGKNSIDFIISLSKNINNIQLFVGEFSDLKSLVGNSKLHFKEHPTNNHYSGVRHEREWIFEQTKGYFPSFFSYWNKASKHAFWNKK